MPTAEPSVEISLKNILVATDFSEGSQRALLTGLGIARRYGAQVHIVHAVPSEGYGVTGVGMLGAANFAWHTAHRLESELLKNRSLEGIHYQLRLEKGEIWPVLSRVIEQECIDLVVVATHGRTGVWKLLLGSVAEKVFRHAACPVLTVGPKRSTSVSGRHSTQEHPFSDRLLATSRARFSVRRISGAAA